MSGSPNTAIDLKELPLVSKVALAIFCVKEIYLDKDWNNWADFWLSNSSGLSIEESIEAYNRCRDSTVELLKRDIDNAPPWAARWAVKAALDYARDHVISAVQEVEDTLSEVEKTWAGIPIKVLTTHFICPHCYKQPNQHTSSGKCLFGAYSWEGINNVWKP